MLLNHKPKGDVMSLIPMFLKELEMEAQTTRKMLQVVPDGKFDWQPHSKSMTVKKLATHVAEMPSWFTTVLTTTELDFEKSDYKPADINTTAELLAYFEKCLAEAKEQLEKANEADLDVIWTMRSGDTIYDASPRGDVIRMTLSHIVHHRAQLGVYLRLLDIPIPGSYGPSADTGF
jgi:uncharacterized damage-inducible protein DinB